MLANSDMIRTALERVKEVVQQSIRNERAREAPPPMKLAYEEQDMAMYDEAGKAPCPDPKKRRGVSTAVVSHRVSIENPTNSRYTESRTSRTMPQLQPRRHSRVATWT